MSINKYKPHILIIPEDDADRQLILGFLLHDAVADRFVGVGGPAGGWGKVLEVFEIEYIRLLRESLNTHVVMLIDFDGYLNRRTQFENKIPEDVRSRVFVIGSKDNPEILSRELGMTLEKIGETLAQDCLSGTFDHWRIPQLSHNQDELQRLIETVKPILFQ